MLSPILWPFRDMGSGSSPIPMNVNTQKIRIEMYDHFRESASQRLRWVQSGLVFRVSLFELFWQARNR